MFSTYTCGEHYYEVYNGETYACSGSSGVSQGCDETHPVTPPATSSSSGCTPNWTYDQLTPKGIVEEIITKQENVNSIASPAQETFAVTTGKCPTK